MNSLEVTPPRSGVAAPPQGGATSGLVKPVPRWPLGAPDEPRAGVSAHDVQIAALPYDRQACRKLMRGGSKSFFAASLLLPQRVREPATALYAFCRLADDAIDLGDDPVAAMAQLRSRLDAVYAGRPGEIDADRALAQVVHRHAIPRALLDALLEGFLWDASGRRYDTSKTCRPTAHASPARWAR